jgi:hypothetical protein
MSGAASGYGIQEHRRWTRSAHKLDSVLSGLGFAGNLQIWFILSRMP